MFKEAIRDVVEEPTEVECAGIPAWTSEGIAVDSYVKGSFDINAVGAEIASF
jgi:hypothetical protein